MWPKFLNHQRVFRVKELSWQKANHDVAYLAEVKDSRWETRIPWFSNKRSFYSIFSTVDVIISSTDSKELSNSNTNLCQLVPGPDNTMASHTH